MHPVVPNCGLQNKWAHCCLFVRRSPKQGPPMGHSIKAITSLQRVAGRQAFHANEPPKGDRLPLGHPEHWGSECVPLERVWPALVPNVGQTYTSDQRRATSGSQWTHSSSWPSLGAAKKCRPARSKTSSKWPFSASSRSSRWKYAHWREL